MSQIINAGEVGKAVKNIINEELTEIINECVDKTIENLKPQIRREVASKVLALAASDYSLQRMGQELHIRVRIE